jgi:hypothetical protein
VTGLIAPVHAVHANYQAVRIIPLEIAKKLTGPWPIHKIDCKLANILDAEKR